MLGGAGGADVAGVDLLGGAGRAFGLDARGFGIGVGDAAALDVVGVAGRLFGADAGGPGTRVGDAAELAVVGVATALAGADEDVLGLLDEPPQPASARRPKARVNVDNLDAERGVA